MARYQRIPSEIIEEIKAKNDIVDVISQYVNLNKRSGSNRFGLCPFHNEHTPSFSVSPSKQIFYCFGCKKGGDVFKFIQEHEHLSYFEAIQFLADRANVKLPVQEDPEQQRIDQLKSQLYRVNHDAAVYFYQNLTHPQIGASAVSYLKSRQLSPVTVKRFGLGYAKDGWQGLYDALKQKGHSDDVLKESGLFRINQSGKLYDFFRDRLMFPIIDTMGRIIAFGGRCLDQSLPKYINSPETLIYKKGQTLYGLNLAKSARSERFILVEGYMDVISLHQAGFDETVAALGTALTPGQVSQLKRYKEQIIVGFDADVAGQMAIMRSFEQLEKQQFEILVLQIPDGKDPDEFLKKNDVAQFKALLHDAQSVTDYLFDRIIRNHQKDGIIQVVPCLDEVAQFVSTMPITQRDIYVSKLANLLGHYTMEQINDDLNRRLHARGKRSNDVQAMTTIQPPVDEFLPLQQPAFTPAPEGPEPQTIVTRYEIRLFILLTFYREIAQDLRYPLEAKYFADPRPESFSSKIIDLIRAEPLTMNELNHLASEFYMNDHPLTDYIASVQQNDFPAHIVRDVVQAEANRLVYRLKMDYLKNRRNWLNDRLDHHELSEIDKASFIKERGKVLKEIQELKQSE